MCVLGAVAFAPSAAFAVCSPSSGNNVTVTCTGTVFDQGPGGGTGYGDSTQNGLALTVQSGASVIGTDIGIDVNDNNTINNFGTINGSGSLFGINGNGQLTVNNSGSIGSLTEIAGINGSPGLMVTNNAGGVISGETAIQGAGLLGVGTATVVNFGLIQGRQIGIDGGSGFADVTNNVGGTITGRFAAINSDQNSVRVTNSGTISTTSGQSGNAISAGDTATVNNLASGIITADGDAITAQTIVLTNAGFNLRRPGFAASAVSGGNVTLTNSGSITSATAGFGISMNSGSVINNAGAIISGDVGIFSVRQHDDLQRRHDHRHGSEPRSTSSAAATRSRSDPAASSTAPHRVSARTPSSSAGPAPTASMPACSPRSIRATPPLTRSAPRLGR